MHPVLVCVLITHVFAVMESGQIGTGLPVARKSISYPLPVENEKTLKPDQNFKKYESRRNVTDLILDHTTAPKSSSLAAFQRQFQEAKKSTRMPANRTMYLRSRATYLKRTNRNISSNQLATAVPPKFVDSLPKLQAEVSETEPRKEPTKLSRKIANVDSTNSVEISNKTHRQFVRKFPTNFRYLLSTTDESEKALLSSHANNASDRNSTETHLAGNTQAKRNERRMLQSLVKNSEPEADEIVTKYKALRKGVAWTHEKLNQSLDAPSARLKEYETLKKYERNFKYDYLDGTTHYPKKKSDGMRLRKRFNLPVRLSTILLPKSTTPASNGSERKNVPDAKRSKRFFEEMNPMTGRKQYVIKVQPRPSRTSASVLALDESTTSSSTVLVLDESTTSSLNDVSSEEPTKTSTEPKKNSMSSIIVAGAIVGAIVVIAGLAGFFYYKRRSRKKEDQASAKNKKSVNEKSKLKHSSSGTKTSHK